MINLTNAFTFQHVSINSQVAQERELRMLHLHSNMYLLILGYGNKVKWKDAHLHSNMYLLILH